jgi:hypothetical protein
VLRELHAVTHAPWSCSTPSPNHAAVVLKIQERANDRGAAGPASLITHAGHMDTAALLLIAHASGDESLGLSVKDREAVLAVLRDPGSASSVEP